MYKLEFGIQSTVRIGMYSILVTMAKTLHMSHFKPNMVSSEITYFRHMKILAIKRHVLKFTTYVKLYQCTKFIPLTFVLFSTKKLNLIV